MVIQTNQTKAKVLIERALDNSADEERYLRRIKSNPKLADLGCVPDNLNEIANNQQPWFCHGLAFRMATYSDSSDYLFERWEKLLSGAKDADGWCGEYAHWKSEQDHWAKKWDRFNQFLWILQCFEYSSGKGLDVSFPASKTEAKPDLCVGQADGSKVYVECYFYTKWWGREHLVEHLLRALDQNLTIKRTYNVSFDQHDNPMSGLNDASFVEALAILGDTLTPEKLDTLRAAARMASPQTVCDFGGFSILLEGSGQYQPSNNAHGDSSASWPIFVNEIIKAKRDSNGLGEHRPNVVMVNGLGLDFQFSFDDKHQNFVLPASLDEIWIYKCGIDAKIETCYPFRLLAENSTK
jgi:hypothetical protein